MLAQFIRKEILDSLLNRRFMALAVFSVVLMPLSAVINYEYYLARRASFNNQYNEFQETRSPSDVRGYRAPELLSVLARGTEPYMPLYYAFGTGGNNVGETQPGNIEAEDFRLLAALGSIDFLFLVQIVFSLLAILLSFDMIAGEKERGTLKAVLANPVPRDSILLGKLLGGFFVLFLAFLIGALLLFLTLVLFDSRFLTAPSLGPLLVIFGISVLFLAGFYTLGLMVSAFCHSTRTAIVALLVFWVLLQLVIPKAGEMIAKVVLPVRSEEAVRVDKATLFAELLDRQMDRGGEMYKRLFATEQLRSSLVNQETPEGERFRQEYKALVEDLWKERNTRLRAINQRLRARAACPASPGLDIGVVVARSGLRLSGLRRSRNRRLGLRAVPQRRSGLLRPTRPNRAGSTARFAGQGTCRRGDYLDVCRRAPGLE